MVAVGGTASIGVRAIALAPGATLPTGALALAAEPLASNALRNAVYYGIDWGYSESAPDQLALALWQLQDGVWRAQDHTIAERISAAAAASQGTPSWLTEGNSTLLAASQGQVTLSELSLAPLPNNSSVGTGNLTVTNTSSGELLLYLPYGTVFSGPNGSVIAWAAPEVPGAQVTPVVQPTEPAATATVAEPTATATAEPPTVQNPPPVKGGTATPTAPIEPTATARPKDSNGTTELPTATATPEPPSATPIPSDTPVPAPTDTPAELSPERLPAAPRESTESSTEAGKVEEATLGAPLPPSAGATAAPNSGQSAPAPVSTSAAAGAPVLPQPVGTQPGAIIPSPVGTVVGTPPGGQVPPPVASVPAGKQVTPTAFRSPTPRLSPTVAQAVPTETVNAAEEKPVEVATPAPTPAPIPPTPAPIPPTAVAPSEGPVINVAPGDTESAAAGGAPSPGESSSAGAAQTYNPNTGGGPSLLPVWLGLLSAVMVLGGWSLRRVSTHAPSRIRREDEE